MVYDFANYCRSDVLTTRPECDRHYTTMSHVPNLKRINATFLNANIKRCKVAITENGPTGGIFFKGIINSDLTRNRIYYNNLF